MLSFPNPSLLRELHLPKVRRVFPSLTAAIGQVGDACRIDAAMHNCHCPELATRMVVGKFTHT
jgi:hypothetical protein